MADTPVHLDAYRHSHPIEEPLDPELAIVDAHHHLFDHPGWSYLDDDFLTDIRTAGRVVGSVFIQGAYSYRKTGPADLHPVGETEFAESLADGLAIAQGDRSRLCCGIIGHADLRLGDAVDRVIEAHLAASPQRFKGIRQVAAWDADPAYYEATNAPAPGLLLDPEFQKGFARLRRFDLSFDCWLFSPQLPDVVALARAFPDTVIVLDHVGTPPGIASYEPNRDAVLAAWRKDISRLAQCDNVRLKIGGLGEPFAGFGWLFRPDRPSSETLAEQWRPIFEHCVDSFTPQRCMFESNAPVDKLTASYSILWNSFKRLATGLSADEKACLFHDTAIRTYRLDIPQHILLPDTGVRS